MHRRRGEENNRHKLVGREKYGASSEVLSECIGGQLYRYGQISSLVVVYYSLVIAEGDIQQQGGKETDEFRLEE